MQAAIGGIAVCTALNISLILGIVITYYVTKSQCKTQSGGGIIKKINFVEPYKNKTILNNNQNPDNPNLLYG